MLPSVNQSTNSLSDPVGKDTPLSEIIFQSLAKKSDPRLRFDQFMEKALYDPDWGYYSGDSARRQIGRQGDFFTSVSVGDVFGTILSHAIEKSGKNSVPIPIFPSLSWNKALTTGNGARYFGRFSGAEQSAFG